MLRNRLKNIINKSKEFSNSKVGDPFELFKNSLPKEIQVGENYRLEAAWKAYGSPKDFKEALWEGMICPINENTFKLPSIGYNEETEEYEYLNKGRENETVAKDIRVWDNDVIPLVKELKLGGYVRIFNEEKECWTYSKNSQKREQPVEDKGEQIIDSFLKGGKPKRSELILLNIANNSNAPFMKRILTNDRRSIPEPQKYWKNGQNSGLRSTHILAYGEKDGKTYVFPEVQEENGELKWFDWPLNLNRAIQNGDYLEMSPEEAEWFTTNYKNYYPHYFGTQSFKQGGQMTTIPSGSLHARKNGMELAEKGEITSKGIPVVDNDGNLLAEIERNEVIFNHSTTTKLEELYKKFSNTDKESEKNEIAIKAGKILTDELINNTQDNTGLILEVAEKNNLEYNK